MKHERFHPAYNPNFNPPELNPTSTHHSDSKQPAKTPKGNRGNLRGGYLSPQTDSFFRNPKNNKVVFDPPRRQSVHKKQQPPRHLKGRPYLEDILGDHHTQNKEIKKNLEELKLLNERLLQGLEGTECRQLARKNEGQWDEIQKVINRLISTSQSESVKFRKSLQQIKELSFNDYFESHGFLEDQQEVESRYYVTGANTLQSNRALFAERFVATTQNERKLLGDIHALKQENENMHRRLDSSLQRFEMIEKRLLEVERHNRVFQKREKEGYRNNMGDRSIIHNGRFTFNPLPEELFSGNHQYITRGQPRKTEPRDNIVQHRDFRNAAQTKAYTHEQERKSMGYSTHQQSQRELLMKLNLLKSESKQLRKDTCEMLKKCKSQQVIRGSTNCQSKLQNLETSFSMNSKEDPLKVVKSLIENVESINYINSNRNHRRSTEDISFHRLLKDY